MKQVLAKRSSAVCNVVCVLYRLRCDYPSLSAQIAKCVNNDTEDQVDHGQCEYRPEGNIVHNAHCELFTVLQREVALSS